VSDQEQDPAWLAGLFDLNSHIQAPVMGNLCYDHLASTLGEPDAELRDKRDRFRQALAGRHALLEIGVNAGHSAYIALTCNPELTYHGVDICEFPYVVPAVEWLQAHFPGRVAFSPGSSAQVLPFAGRFDALHLDGAKDLYASDFAAASTMLTPGAVVVMDDTQQPAVAALWASLPLKPLLPSMSLEHKYRNEVGIGYDDLS